MRILVIEDTRFSSLMIEGLLKSLDHIPVCVSSGYDAIAYLEANQNIDAVICDLYLQDIDGFKVFEECKQLEVYSSSSGNILPPFILLTASKDAKDLRHAESVGFVAALTKPLKSQEMENILAIIDAGNIHIRRDLEKSKIIVVDPASKLQSVLHEVFYGTGYTLLFATSATEATELLREYQGIKMIITELTIGNLNAMELLAQLKSEADLGHAISELPFVLLTDTADIDLLQVAYVSGFAHIIHGTLEKFILKQKFNKLFSEMGEQSSDVRIILVVDDVGFQCALLRNLLTRSTFIQSKPFQILTASSGYEAMDLLKSHPSIEMVITDLMLPDMQGTDIFKRYHEFIENATQYGTQAKQAPHFLLLTCSTDASALSDAKRMGFSETFKKPINAQHFMSVVENLLSLQNSDRKAIAQ